jgi:hypothetical protein
MEDVDADPATIAIDVAPTAPTVPTATTTDITGDIAKPDLANPRLVRRNAHPDTGRLGMVQFTFTYDLFAI